MTETATTPDISGVPTGELAAVYAEHIGIADASHFAFRVGIDPRDLKKIVVHQNYAFTGLRLADFIIMELGQNISALEQRGEIHVVPRWPSMKCALQMVDEELRVKAEAILYPRMPEAWLHGEAHEEIEAVLTAWIKANTTAADRNARANELIDLHRRYILRTDEQKARSRADSTRKKR